MASRAKRWDLIILAICSAIFFVSTLILTWGVPWVFNSPDENANAFFAEVMRAADRLAFIDPANVDLGGILHPRSVITVGVFLVPGSFVGLPVFYGLAGKVIGITGMRLLTPLLAVLAIFAWRSVVEKVFSSRRLALVSALAILFHPAFWYYTGRGFMHNVPFVGLLMIASYALVIKPWKRAWIAPLLCGLFVGLALWFRTSEAVWVLPVLAALLFLYRHKLGTRTVTLTLLALIVTLLPLLPLHAHLYGSPLTTGYTYQPPDALTPAPVATELAAELDPFNPGPRTVIKHMWQYATVLFPWMSFAAFAGFVSIFRRKLAPRAYLWLTLAVSAWLFAFYGSWMFHDNPDPALATIGTSYVRYWLPIFVLLSPFVAHVICWIADQFWSKHARNAALAVLVVGMIGASIHPVFFAPDGLVGIRQSLLAYADTRSEVLRNTEENAIIIVDRADKFLWPYRRVVQPLRSETTYSAMPALVDTAPLYYFGITFPQIDLDYLNNEKLPPLGLSIYPIVTIGEESLYRIYESP